MSSIHAIYENGVFRPVQIIDLAEGERVEIEILSSNAIDSAHSIPALTGEGVI